MLLTVEYIEEFQNEEEILKMWYTIFGKRNKRGIPDSEYPDKDVFMKKAEDIFRNPEFLTNNNEPTVVMAFLPQNNIEKISKATMSLLKKNNVIPDYEIVCINSMEKGDPKNRIELAVSKAKDSKKKVLVLSGKQCSLGVTIKQCDVVLLLNNSNSFDMIYQMMFRCMTERKDKKSGIVIDLNIQRCLEVVVSEYASLLNPELHPKEAIQYLLKERIINLNGNDWISSFGKCDERLQNLCNSVYKYCSSNTQKILTRLLDRLKDKEPELESRDLKFVNSFFTGKNSPKKITVKEEKEEEKVKDGIEKERIEKKSPDLEEDEPEEVKKINFMDIIKHLIPLICILTIRNEETILKFMYKKIKEEEKIHSILINQTSIWWGKIIKSESIEKLIQLYIKYMDKNKDVEKIIRTVKELFIQNKRNRRGLSQAIDSYLIPQELEKKTNAEISTPFKLRQEMLDKIPVDFWKKKRKVFEPCSGKGGFLIDIVDRFMEGLEDEIPLEEERYKIIVEECLYFSDINSANIFISKLLLDPEDKYDLKYSIGNTLELNIKRKWDVDIFDAIIGNPPYNKNLYKKFTEYSLNITKFLLFVIPSTFTIGVSHKKFIENLKKNGIKLVKYLDRNEWNIKIDIDTLYLLCDKNYTGDIIVNSIPIERCDNIYNVDTIYNEILNKIKKFHKLELVKGQNNTLTYKNPTETEHIKFEKSEKYKYKILSRLNGGRGEQIYYTDVEGKREGGYKILFPRGTATYNSKNALKNMSKPLVYSKITNENVLLSTGIVYIKTDNLKESELIQWYLMNSKFVRFLFIKENKFSELTKGFVKLIPKIDYKYCINKDDSIYNHLGLTGGQIKYIENLI